MADTTTGPGDSQPILRLYGSPHRASSGGGSPAGARHVAAGRGCGITAEAGPASPSGDDTMSDTTGLNRRDFLRRSAGGGLALGGLLGLGLDLRAAQGSAGRFKFAST